MATGAARRTLAKAPEVQIVDRSTEAPHAAFARTVSKGLRSKPRSLPFHLALDAEGRKLFDKMRSQPDVYVGKAEREILTSRASTVTALFPDSSPQFIDLGPRTPKPAELILRPFLERDGQASYVAIGGVPAEVEAPAIAIAKRLPGTAVTGIVGRLHDGIREARRISAETRWIAWFGGGIGRLDRAAAVTFVRLCASILTPRGVLLLGVDLRKSRRVAERSVDDRAGVSRALHLHMLERVNRELGANFEKSSFRHRAQYDDAAATLETSLVASRQQEVFIRELDQTVTFSRGEAIRTSVAHMYSPTEIDALATAAGMVCIERWYERDGRYCLNVLRLPPR